MRALVTGASGFIGSTLIEELNTLGFDVVALMRRKASPRNLGAARFTRVEGDLSDIESLKRAVKDVDYVFHLAGAITAPNREGFFEANAEGTRRLAEAVAEACPNLQRFVFVSSLAAGGPQRERRPRRESDPDQPVSAYGESKLAGERELLKFKDRFPISIVRPPMVFGPRDKATFIFVKTVARNLIPVFKALNGDGQKYYSHIHVRDLVRGIVQSALAPHGRVASGEIFYLCADAMVSYDEIMRTIAGFLERDPVRIPVPRFALTAAAYAATGFGKLCGRTFSLNTDKLNEMLPDYWICSNQKARELLHFAPEFDVSTGWSNAIDWYKRERWI